MLALNRSAIVVRPKLPFLEWLHSADPTSATLTLADLALEPTIYLVPECADGEQERAALQTAFRTIFENQLDGWWRDRTMCRRPGLLERSGSGSIASSIQRCSAWRTSRSLRSPSNPT